MITRRKLLAAAAVAPLASTIARAAPPPTTSPATSPSTTQSANDRPGVAMIGCGSIGNYHALFSKPFANIVAIGDVDKNRAAGFNAKWAEGKAAVSGDYRELIARKDVDLVWVCTPDHWHTKIAIDALRAGKDVYCEKPATLTIDESKLLCRVVRETGRILQVGTQQRQDEKFLTAVALCHAGRLGKINRVVIALGETPRSKEYLTAAPPPELNWDMWLGQTPKIEFANERFTSFRWFYEYSGGLMTDWGAHHVDIAQWAIAPDLPAPYAVDPLSVTNPIEMKNGYPTRVNGFNTAREYCVKCSFANGVEMFIRDSAPVEAPEKNGIQIEGDKGFVFVNRDVIRGSAFDALKDNPLPDNFLAQLPLDKSIEQPHQRHIAEFIRCAREHKTPRSDVWGHHKILTTCHLANIAMRLARRIEWDATLEKIVGDAEANTFLARPQRKGFETA